MNSTRYLRSLSSLVCCFLLSLLVACGNSSGDTQPTAVSQNPTITPTSGSTTVVTPGTAPTPTVITLPVPQTQTSCPTVGTGRAAVLAPLALGNHQNIVYLVRELQGNTVTSTLKRYDLTTDSKTEIVKLANLDITNAQVSTDGQWLLFVASTGAMNKLQLVRLDGQGLQTLYCSSNGAIQNALWSSNQKLVLFSDFSNNMGGIELLNLETGNVQLELQPNDSGAPLHMKYAGMPFSWLDNTRAYISFTDAPIAPINMLGLLDTNHGPNQHLSDLAIVFQDKPSQPYNYPCWDADSSYDGHTLFTNQCSGYSAPNCSGSCTLGTRQGPDIINTEPVAGGATHAIFTNQALGIESIRAISSNTLLLQVDNFSVNRSVDLSQNGLWKLNTDGTGLTRLTTDVKGNTTTLCPFSQNPWSNASRDGSMYAFETVSTGNYPQTYSLFFGMMSGGPPTAIASIADGTTLTMVGWTTF